MTMTTGGGILRFPLEWNRLIKIEWDRILLVLVSQRNGCYNAENSWCQKSQKIQNYNTRKFGRKTHLLLPMRQIHTYE